MIIIEHRRHSMRTMPGQDLSQAGVDLARRVGGELGVFDLVITSTVARAFQTAIAMGYAVDEQLDELARLPEGFEDEVAWDAGYARFREVALGNPTGAVAAFARTMESLHRRVAERVAPSGRALIISHGAFPEGALIGCVPATDCTTWGSAGYCEGIRLHVDGTTFVRAELLRVDAASSDG